MCDLLRQGLATAVAIEPVDQVQETAHRAGCPAAQAGRAQQVHRCLPQRQALHPRRIAQQFQGTFADAARRRVDGALEGRIVIAVSHQTQIGQRILDLGALEKAQPAINAIRQGGADQIFLEYPRLSIGAIQNGRVAPLAAGLYPLADALDHEARLVRFIEGGVDLDRRTITISGP